MLALQEPADVIQLNGGVRWLWSIASVKNSYRESGHAIAASVVVIGYLIPEVWLIDNWQD